MKQSCTRRSASRALLAAMRAAPTKRMSSLRSQHPIASARSPRAAGIELAKLLTLLALCAVLFAISGCGAVRPPAISASDAKFLLRVVGGPRVICEDFQFQKVSRRAAQSFLMRNAARLIAIQRRVDPKTLVPGSHYTIGQLTQTFADDVSARGCFPAIGRRITSETGIGGQF